MLECMFCQRKPKEIWNRIIKQSSHYGSRGVTSKSLETVGEEGKGRAIGKLRTSVPVTERAFSGAFPDLVQAIIKLKYIFKKQKQEKQPEFTNLKLFSFSCIWF